MDDSFRVRVEKTFGSLAAAATPPASSSDTPAQPTSLWCLTDEEIEKREWNRGKDTPDDEDLESKPYPSNLDGFFSDLSSSGNERLFDVHKSLDPDLLEVDDDDEEDDDADENDKKSRRGALPPRQLVKPEDHNDEEWDIRSSIGLDCTLDNEEEEDAYDKVAIGDERTGDCLYMGDVAEYKIDRNPNEVPNKFRDVDRGSRVDQLAAQVRLREDAEAAGNFNSLRVSHDTVPQDNTLTDGVNLKSILKKRGNQMESKTGKRVRFDPECKDDREEEDEDYEGTKILTMGSPASFFPQDSDDLPDYLRNPSKYTHYTFDSSSDIDEESNRKAYMDFLDLLKGPSAIDPEDDIRKNPPKTVTFTPKKRAGDDSMNKLKEMEEDVCKEENPKLSFPVSIAESEVCAMEEDDQGNLADNSRSSRKRGRQYRVKTNSELVDDHGT